MIDNVETRIHNRFISRNMRTDNITDAEKMNAQKQIVSMRFTYCSKILFVHNTYIKNCNNK